MSDEYQTDGNVSNAKKEKAAMNLAEAVEIVEQALAAPVSVWPGFSPKNVPLVLYDEQGFTFLNHPAPPHERPSQLTAATTVEIEGILTATIPISLSKDEKNLIPLVYHEAFHVYQGKGVFRFAEQFHFFEVLALYPELDGTYRALCRAEVEVLNSSDLSAEEKAVYLAALAEQRYAILSRRQGLLQFEKTAERKEGTASYVEQCMRACAFAIPPDPVVCNYGWSRQYDAGAATCRLLDELAVEGWYARVEAGESLFDILIQEFYWEGIDLARLNLVEKIACEQEKAEQIRSARQTRIDKLVEAGVIRLHLPTDVMINRSFNPTRLLSLGDGRLLHDDFLLVQLPSGTISLRNGDIVEDYNHNELIFREIPLQLIGDRLEATAPTAQISLTGVNRVGKSVFAIE